MSVKSHKSEYTILAVLGLVTALALLGMALSGMLHERHAGRTGVRTTRSASDDGLLIGYTLFQRLGLPVERSDRLLVTDQLAGVGVVFLIDPLVPVGAVESEDLGAWVARGGVLVTTEVLPSLSPTLKQLTRERPSHPRSVARSLGPGYFTKAPAEAKPLPLARDVEKTFFETGAALEAGEKSPNTSISVMEPLFREGRGVRIAQWKVGRGRLILLSDGSFLANANIPAGDNAVLAANLISYALAAANVPKVSFNEFHFGAGGFGRGMGVLAGMLFTTSPGWAILAVTVAGLLFLFYQGRQFGPRRDLSQQRRRRSKLEYVRAVGATYRAAGAHRLALRLIHTWFRQQLMNRTGLTASVSNSVMAQELARRGRSSAVDYQRILDGCERILSQPTISQRQLTLAVAQLARIEKEILHGSGNGTQPGR